MVVRKETFTVRYMDEDRTESHPNREAALAAASTYVGNNSYAKPFPNEETYLFGFGDGATAVMVRQDFDIVRNASPQ